MSELGGLAAALAKAQAAFPAVQRDKEVRVQTRTGGSYSFKYAPLDSILTATRKPLTENGLAVAQLLDGDDLVTVLLHESGERLEGRMPLPHAENQTIQELGSAITYLRRYSIQAILGIAAEEDDDGNSAAGNTYTTRSEAQTNDGSLIGTVTKGRTPVDLELRQTPEGPAAGFKLAQGRSGIQVLATGNLATALAPFLAGLVDKRVAVWGSVVMVPWDKDGVKMPPYKRLILSRIRTDDWELPGNIPAAQPAGGDEAESEALPWTADEVAEAVA